MTYLSLNTLLFTAFALNCPLHLIFSNNSSSLDMGFDFILTLSSVVNLGG